MRWISDSIRSGNARRPCWLQPYDGPHRAGRLAQPAHRESEAADRTDFDRDLVVRATDAAGLNLNQRTDIVDGVVEHFQSALAGLFFDLRESAVDDAFCNRLLAIEHDHIDELGNFNAAELRIRQNFALRYFATTGHLNSSFDTSVLYVLRSPTGASRTFGLILRTKRPRLTRSGKPFSHDRSPAADAAKPIRPPSGASRRTWSGPACGP